MVLNVYNIQMVFTWFTLNFAQCICVLKNIKYLRSRAFGQNMVANIAFFFLTYCCCSFWKTLHKTFDQMVAFQHWGKTDRRWTLAHKGHTDGQCCCLWNTTSNYPMNFWNTTKEGLQLTNQTNCCAGISIRCDRGHKKKVTPVYLSVVEAESAIII